VSSFCIKPKKVRDKNATTAAYGMNGKNQSIGFSGGKDDLKLGLYPNIKPAGTNVMMLPKTRRHRNRGNA
jgi:hypothetical protein